MKNLKHVLNELRKNARIPMTEISKKHGISKGSTYIQLGNLKKKYITKFVTLINFAKIGYPTRVVCFLNMPNRQLPSEDNINTATKLSGKHNLMIEYCFRNNEEANKLFETLEDYKPKMYHIVEDISSEEFKI